MDHFKRSLVLCLIFFLTAGILFGCKKKTDTADKEKTKKNAATGQAVTVSEAEATEIAEKIVRNMTLNEKVGQMFFVNLNGLNENKTNTREYTKRMGELIERYHLGGVILEEDNFYSREQVQELTRELSQVKDIPLYIGMTEEGGGTYSVAYQHRDFGYTAYAEPSKVSSYMEEDAFKRMGSNWADECTDLGVNLNLAPKAELAHTETPVNEEAVKEAIRSCIGKEPSPPKISEKTGKKKQKKIWKRYQKARKRYFQRRTELLDKYVVDDYEDRLYGTDADSVKKITKAILKGTKGKKVSTVTGVFPGISSVADYHQLVPLSLDTSLSQLRKEDLVSFAGMKKSAGMVLGNVTMSKLDPEHPLPMSKTIIQKLIRDEMGFNGFLMTESLQAPSLTNQYTSKEIVTQMINAGVDVLYDPANIGAAITTVEQAVIFEKIDERLINQAAIRVIRSKILRGIIEKDYEMEES